MEKELSNRILFAVVGGLFGLAAYGLTEFLEQITENKRVMLVTFLTVYGFFGVFLAMLGVVNLRKIAAPAAALALFGALMLFWSSFRFGSELWFDKLNFQWVAYLTLMAFSTIFLIARFGEGQSWFRYEVLFPEAWALLVRKFLAGLFTGLTLGVLWLAAFLLELVNLSFLKLALQEPWFIFPLCGAIYGAALAVILELNHVVGALRGLVLRLLRLLLPLVAVVSAVFLIAAPFQGFTAIFKEWSAAGTMLAIAIAGVSFISAALDARNEEAANSRFMLWTIKAMCLLLPFLCGLAIYAIWLRVTQYGWTPERLAAVASASVLAVYAVLYAYRVLRANEDWRASIRQVNVAVAGFVVVLAVLWLSPILNAERISVASQVERALRGNLEVTDLSLAEMRWDWGLAGEKGIGQIRAFADESANAPYQEALATLDAAENRWQFNRDQREGGAQNRLADIQDVVDVLPPDSKVPDEIWRDIAAFEYSVNRCKETRSGAEKGCLLVVIELDERYDGPEYLFAFTNVQQDLVLRPHYLTDKKTPRNVHFKSIPKNKGAEKVYEALSNGAFDVKPLKINTITIGGKDVFQIGETQNFEMVLPE